MTRTTRIRWIAPSVSAGGTLLASCDDDGDEVEFDDYLSALAWARDRGDRVVVTVDGMGRSASDTGLFNAAEVVGHIASSRARFEREAATYEPPVEWYVAVQRDRWAQSVTLATAINAASPATAEVLRRDASAEDHVWLVLNVRARSARDAVAVASGHFRDTIHRGSTNLPMGSYSLGDVRVGLAEYRERDLRGKADP